MLRMLVTAILLIGTAQGMAATSSDVFKRHSNRIVVESGSFFGDGIEAALQAGFKEVYSVELSPQLCDSCKQRFRSNPHVHLYLGDSSEVFKDILDDIHERATFWLDGHYGEGITAIGKTNTPILQELALIGTHSIKNHTILIDDVRQFGTVHFDFIELDEIIAAIKQINPNYEISYENGYVPNDVLVAEIKR